MNSWPGRTCRRCWPGRRRRATSRACSQAATAGWTGPSRPSAPSSRGFCTCARGPGRCWSWPTSRFCATTTGGTGRGTATATGCWSTATRRWAAACTGVRSWAPRTSPAWIIRQCTTRPSGNPTAAPWTAKMWASTASSPWKEKCSGTWPRRWATTPPRPGCGSARPKPGSSSARSCGTRSGRRSPTGFGAGALSRASRPPASIRYCAARPRRSRRGLWWNATSRTRGASAAAGCCRRCGATIRPTPTTCTGGGASGGP